MNPFSITETIELLPVVEDIKSPSSYLSNIFFKEHVQTYSDVLAVEYTKSHRRLAPYVSEGSKGVNMRRDASQVAMYRAPLIGGRRTLSAAEISQRILGEQPIFSKLTPADRALQIQANDMRDLKNMVVNKQEKMAAELLTTGKLKIRAFADDGKIVEEPEIIFDEDYVATATVTWDNSSATIYEDIKSVCDYIAEEAGALPDVMICGANIERYLLNNAEIYKWLSILNADNLKMMSFAPRFDSPQSRYIGTINSLGLEVRTYQATYIDDISGQVTPFIPADTCIIGISGSGKYLFGRVDVLKGGAFQSYASEIVPYTSYSEENQTASITLLSRCLPVPNVVESVRCLKVK